MNTDTREYLIEFLRESNAIEGIHRDPTDAEIEATHAFLERPNITVEDLEKLVSVYAPGHGLRIRHGQNVRVGNYIAPRGGPNIRTQLQEILELVNGREFTSSWKIHVQYELLHPFTDGNGRSGRALWLWVIGGRDRLSFLHRFYYQTLAVMGTEPT